MNKIKATDNYDDQVMTPSTCAICGRSLPESGYYIVRTDVYADPSLPPTTSSQLHAMDFKAAVEELMKQLLDMSADEIQDQVFRRFEHRICAACQPAFLANPMGLPRQKSNGHN